MAPADLDELRRHGFDRLRHPRRHPGDRRFNYINRVLMRWGGPETFVRKWEESPDP